MAEALSSDSGAARSLWSKVPEITIYFWIIKVLCTTVGETGSDYLSVNLGLGLGWTSVIMGLCLAVFLGFQLASHRYRPALYWIAVVLVSVFGTLITDDLTDVIGVPLELSTVVFSGLLVVIFALWYAVEKTLSIHSIYTFKREIFYWLAVLCTFALGTAAGDLMAESMSLGYLLTGVIVLSAIVTTAIAWRFGLNAILAFWIIYIFTRPLGASLGDFLTQSKANGGLGLGASVTSGIFIAAIVGVIIFLSVTGYDAGSGDKGQVSADPKNPQMSKRRVVWQIVAVAVLLISVSGIGYYFQQQRLYQQAQAGSSHDAPLGDLSEYVTITHDTLSLVQSGDLSQARTRVRDLEFVWDKNEGRLRMMNGDQWTVVDDAIDDVLHRLRAAQQDADACTTSLQTLLDVLKKISPASHV